MTWSLNEIEALAKKAARGAGMDWGLAEETGRATRLLLERGFDGAGMLADLLAATDGTPYEHKAPVDSAGRWAAPCGTLCPVAAGACLSDHAVALRDGPLTMAQTAFPLFLVPFAQSAAQHLNQTVLLEWEGAMICVSGQAIELTGTSTLAATDWILCTLTDAVPAPQTRLTRADISPETVARLGAFAHRTYAPATEESRLAGAGAGLSDND